MKEQKKGEKLHRGKPKGIARKLAAQKQSLFEKECVSIDGIVADFPEYSDFIELHSEQFEYTPDPSAEPRMLAAFKNAIRNCDASFFERLAQIAKQQKRAMAGESADPLGASVMWAIKKLKGKPASVKNVLNAIGFKGPDGEVYEEREIRRAMKGLGIPIEKEH